MAKFKIKPNKSFPPSAALSAASPKDLNVIRKTLTSIVEGQQAKKKARVSKAALGSK